jgi:hypothetical protein
MQRFKMNAPISKAARSLIVNCGGPNLTATENFSVSKRVEQHI